MASYASVQDQLQADARLYREALARYNSLLQRASAGENNFNLVDQIDAELARVSALKARVRQTIFTDIPNINDAGDDDKNSLLRTAYTLEGNIDTLEQDLYRLRKDVIRNSQTNPAFTGVFNTDTPVAQSTGTTVQDDQNARAESSNTQNPEVAGTTTNQFEQQTTQTDGGGTSNAEEYTLGDPANDYGPEGGGLSTVGGDIPVRKQSQTQSGDTSNTDDAYFNQQTTTGVSTATGGRPEISDEFLKPIVPTANKLSNLASTAYSISIYLMNSAEYRKMIASANFSLPSQQLLIQSGGAPIGKRNRWFDLDFYIENVDIETVIGTQDVGSAHTIGNINMTIVEPNGITFLNRLRRAVQEHTQISNSDTSELGQHYLMVVRFYGYDQDGNFISSSQIGNEQSFSDPRSIAEKFIPFTIANVSYNITTNNTQYNLICTGINTHTAFSTARGTIPFNTQLIASDLATLLNGKLALADGGQDDEQGFADLESGTNVPEATKVSGLEGKTITQGLADALNKHQKLLVSQGAQDFADEYVIELADIVGLKDARMAKPGRQSKTNATMNRQLTPADKFLSSKLVYNKDIRGFNIAAGTQISQLIDLVMKTSSYVTSQQNVIFDEKTGKVKGKTSDVDTVQWYRVRAKAEPTDNFDKKRKDYAYKITYTISPYQINTPRTPSFPTARYRGVHKRYDYWFTGKNTEVLNFSIDVNSNFVTVIGNDGLADTTPQGRFVAKSFYQSAPNGTLQGGLNGSSIPAAALSDRLYNSADVAKASVQIMGDPDWIQQSDFYLVNKIDLGSTLSDGSLNFEASEILYEIRWNPVNDYDINTGLMPKIGLPTQVNDSDQILNEDAQEIMVWAATNVTSSFSNGSFTQTLQGTYRNFAGAKDAPDNVAGGSTSGTNSTGTNTLGGSAGDFEGVDLYPGIEVEIILDDQVPGVDKLSQSNPGSSPTVVPSRSVVVDANGNTRNFNVQKSIDSGQPFVDTVINGQVTRVYGDNTDLLRYYGDNAVAAKPGSTVVSDDAGDTVYTG